MTPRHVLVNTLRDQYRAERVCIGRLTHINKSERLTENEHRLMDAQIADEIQHARLMREALTRYGVGSLPPYDVAEAYTGYRDVVTAPEDPAMGLADFCAIERYIGAMLPKARDMFREAGDAETHSAYETLCADDDRHIPFNRAVMKRLFDDPEIGTAMRARYAQRVGEGHHQALFRKAAQSEAV